MNFLSSQVMNGTEQSPASSPEPLLRGVGNLHSTSPKYVPSGSISTQSHHKVKNKNKKQKSMIFFIIRKKKKKKNGRRFRIVKFKKKKFFFRKKKINQIQQ